MEKVQTKDMQSYGGYWHGDVFLFTVTRATIHGIAKYDPSGAPGKQLSLFTGSQPGFQNGHVTEARYQNPTSICKSMGQAFSVADTNNHAVRSINNDYVTTLIGTGSAGKQDGPQNSATLNFPRLLSETTDHLIISEDNSPNKLRVFSRKSGTLSTVTLSTGNPAIFCSPTCLTRYGPDFAICTPNAIYNMVLPADVYSPNAQAQLTPLLVLGPRAKFYSAQFLRDSGTLVFSIGSSIRALTANSSIIELNDLTLENPSAMPFVAVSDKNSVTVIDQNRFELFAGTFRPPVSAEAFSAEFADTSISAPPSTFGEPVSYQSPSNPSQSPSMPPQRASGSFDAPPNLGWNSGTQGQVPANYGTPPPNYGTPPPSAAKDRPSFDPYGSNPSGGYGSPQNPQLDPSFQPPQTASNPPIGPTGPVYPYGSGSGSGPLSGSGAQTGPGYGYDSSTSSPASTNNYAQTQNPPSGFPPGYPPQGPSSQPSYQQSPVNTGPGVGVAPTMPTNTFTAPPPSTNPASYGIMNQQQQYAMPNTPGNGQLPNPSALMGVIGAPPTFAPPVAVQASVPVYNLQQNPVQVTQVVPMAVYGTSQVQTTTQIVQAVPAQNPASHHHHHRTTGSPSSSTGKKNEQISATGIWEWEASFETWTPYDANIHNQITSAYMDGKSKAVFLIGSTQYEIDFTVMPTRQVQSHNKSRTRRVRGPANCPLPIIN